MLPCGMDLRNLRTIVEICYHITPDSQASSVKKISSWPHGSSSAVGIYVALTGSKLLRLKMRSTTTKMAIVNESKDTEDLWVQGLVSITICR